MIFCPSCNIGIDHQQMEDRKCNSCLHEWDIWHVYPVADTKDHSMSHQCICPPIVEEANGNIIVIHNSFDGREGVEWTNEILSR